METFEYRPYDSSFYIINPKQTFRVKLGELNPALRIFIYEKTNYFGDPVPADLTGYFLSLLIYDNNHNLITKRAVLITDLKTSEIECQFKKFDFKSTGLHYFDFQLKFIDDSILTLPNEGEKLQVIIY